MVNKLARHYDLLDHVVVDVQGGTDREPAGRGAGTAVVLYTTRAYCAENTQYSTLLSTLGEYISIYSGIYKTLD